MGRLSYVLSVCLCLCASVNRYLNQCGWPAPYSNACQAVKSGRHGKVGPYQTFTATRFMEVVCLDVVGPLKTTENGNTHILTIMDKFSRLITAIPLQDTTAGTIANVFWTRWCCNFSAVPELILTDRGSNFVGKLMKEFTKYLNINAIKTTPYNPGCNGTIERFHRFMKERIAIAIYLGIIVFEEGKWCNWDVLLPSICMAYNTSKHKGTGFQPRQLAFGEKSTPIHSRFTSIQIDELAEHKGKTEEEVLRDLIMSLRMMQAEAAYRNEIVQRQQLDRKNRKEGRVDHDLYMDDLVLLDTRERRVGTKRKLLPKYEGPFRVAGSGRTNVNVWIEDVRTGETRLVRVDKLKTYFEDDLQGKRIEEHDTHMKRLAREEIERKEMNLKGNLKLHGKEGVVSMDVDGDGDIDPEDEEKEDVPSDETPTNESRLNVARVFSLCSNVSIPLTDDEQEWIDRIDRDLKVAWEATGYPRREVQTGDNDFARTPFLLAKFMVDTYLGKEIGRATKVLDLMAGEGALTLHCPPGTVAIEKNRGRAVWGSVAVPKALWHAGDCFNRPIIKVLVRYGRFEIVFANPRFELAIPCIALAMRMLKEGGSAVFLLPATYFNDKTRAEALDDLGIVIRRIIHVGRFDYYRNMGSRKKTGHDAIFEFRQATKENQALTQSFGVKGVNGEMALTPLSSAKPTRGRV